MKLQDVKTLEPKPEGLLEGVLEKLFNRMDIGTEQDSGGGLYLRRWRVFGYGSKLPALFGYSVMLHRMVRPDQDKDPHDHPWTSWWSRVLWGSYIEDIWEAPDIKRARHEHDLPNTLVRSAGEVAQRMGEHMHKVVNLPHGECWTLVWTTGRGRRWGFWTENGWVFWKTYMGLKDDEAGQVAAS